MTGLKTYLASLVTQHPNYFNNLTVNEGKEGTEEMGEKKNTIDKSVSLSKR